MTDNSSAPQPGTLKPMLSVPDLSALLGVPTKTVYAWTSARTIPFYRVGRHVRFDADQVQGWLQERYLRPVEDVV